MRTRLPLTSTSVMESLLESDIVAMLFSARMGMQWKGEVEGKQEGNQDKKADEALLAFVEIAGTTPPFLGCRWRGCGKWRDVIARGNG